MYNQQALWTKKPIYEKLAKTKEFHLLLFVLQRNDMILIVP